MFRNKILLINLAILIGYIVVINLTSDSGAQYKGLDILLFSMVAIAVHAAINFLISIVNFIQRNKELGVTYLLSAFLVALIGAGACFASASV